MLELRLRKWPSLAFLIGAALLSWPRPLAALVFDQVIVFGDSTVDSGFYRALPNPGGNATFNADWPAAVGAGAGIPTSSPGPMYSQLLASYFGLTANPANQGGTNFATSGAKNVDVNTSQNGGFGAAIPTVTQIANYLTAVANQADPNALYLISSGNNDIKFALGLTGTGPFPGDPNAYMVSRANSLAAAIASLKAAGAQTFIVSQLTASFPTNSPTEQQLRATYNQALAAALAGQGVTVTFADINSVRLAILASPAQFGFTTISNATGNSACVQPGGGITTAWALLCSSSASAPSKFVSANADMTRLFADDEHLATAGQKIVANYIYSLIPPPASSPLVAAVLPASRSVQVANPATAFASIVNSSNATASNCQISPVSNVNGRFAYQTTDPATNQLTGTANTPVSIPAGQSQTFLLAFTPTAPFVSADVQFVYVCTGMPSVVPIVGINSLRLTFDANPVPDMIAIGLTSPNDGYAHTGGVGGTGIFAVAAVNIGVTANLTARLRVLDPATPLTALLCETFSSGPTAGQCKATQSATVNRTVNQNETTTWTAFVTSTGPIAQDAAHNRIFFEFIDGGGVVRGSTSTAVTTN